MFAAMMAAIRDLTAEVHLLRLDREVTNQPPMESHFPPANVLAGETPPATVLTGETPPATVLAGETSEQRYARARASTELQSEPQAVHHGELPTRTRTGITPELATTKESDVKIKAPEWNGKREDLDVFLDQCNLHFELNHQRYPTEAKKVLWAIGYISGPPRERLRNLRAAGVVTPWLATWDAFAKELERTYGDPNPGHTARIKLNRLKQYGPVSDHVAEFKMLMTRANATDEQQMLTAFQLSLRDSLRQRLLHVETTSLQAYMDAAICTEQRLHEIGLYTATTPPNRPDTRPAVTAGDRPRQTTPTPNRWGERALVKPLPATPQGWELPDEVRRHRRENNLCYGCGGTHQVKDCPKTGRINAIPANTITFDPQDGQLLMNPEKTGKFPEGDDDLESPVDSPLSYDPGEPPGNGDQDPLWARSVRWRYESPAELRAQVAALRTDDQSRESGVVRIRRHSAIPTYECFIEIAHLKGFALVDCGATASFVTKDLLMTTEPMLEQILLPRPKPALMMSGLSEPITHHIEAQVKLEGVIINPHHRFYVAPVISQHEIILGMDWIEATRPTFNYRDGTLDINVPDSAEISAHVVRFQSGMLCSPDPVVDPETTTTLMVYRADLHITHNADSVPDLASIHCSPVFSYTGLSDTIVSGRGRTFGARLWTDILELSGTTPAPSTADHRQTDGQTDRVTPPLEPFLWLYVTYQPTDWPYWLPFSQLGNNNCSSGVTVVPPPLPVHEYTPNILPHIPATPANDLSSDGQTNATLLATCRGAIDLAATRIVGYYHRSRIDRSFRGGDLVLLPTEHLRIDAPNRKMTNPLADPLTVAPPVDHWA
jgi:hypothetical protein